MGSSDKDGLVGHKKLIEWLAKQQFTWSSDLPTILAADWVFRNPPIGNSTATSTPEVDVFLLTKAVLEDRIVVSPAARVVAALIGLNSHVYEQFAKVPQLGIVAPTPGSKRSRNGRQRASSILLQKFRSSSPATIVSRMFACHYWRLPTISVTALRPARRSSSSAPPGRREMMANRRSRMYRNSRRPGPSTARTPARHHTLEKSSRYRDPDRSYSSQGDPNMPNEPAPLSTRRDVDAFLAQLRQERQAGGLYRGRLRRNA
jgi:hypothetical protein